MAVADEKRRTFVIVHGGWGGGWEWEPVARLLRERGHEVHTPTLSGLAERAGLGPEVGVSQHGEEIARLLEFELLEDVVLCGASYSGMVITQAAELVPERVGRLVYIDSFLPVDGESILDLVPEFTELVDACADERGHGWVPMPEEFLPPEGLIEEAERRRYVDRLRDHPLLSFTEPVSLTGAVDGVEGAFLRCDSGEEDEEGIDPFDAMAERARSRGWPQATLPLPHDPHLFDPEATATALEELARAETELTAANA